jgi:CubicO group peptidase (beta-lactamase class C family)
MFPKHLNRMAGCRLAGVLALALAVAPPLSAGADQGRSTEPSAAPAEPRAPDTAAGRRLGALLAALNRGELAPLQALVADSFETAQHDAGFPATRAHELQRLARITGGLALRRIERSASAQVQALAQARLTGAWYRISIFTTASPPDFVEAAAPHRIVGIGIHSATAPAELAETGLGERQLRARLDRLMKALVQADGFAGVVQVQRSGRTLYQRAFGPANRQLRLQNGPDTRFNLASITKMFTAVAIGQLVEAGKLDLAAPVGTILPELAGTDLGRLVTVHHLLSHTAGMIGARASIEQGLEPPRTARSIEAMAAAFMKAPLASRPGQQFDYSNGGYILLGAIIERVSGEDYHAYVRRHVFAPAGMRNTGFHGPGDDPRRTAVGYQDGPSGSRSPNTEQLALVGSPANMAFSTAADMVRFAEALMRGRLLGKDLLARFWTGVTERPDGAEYGYGASIERYNGRRIVWHGGGSPGVTNRFEMVPEEDLSIVILSNIDSEPEIIVNKLREWLSARRVPAQAPEAPPALALSVQPAEADPSAPGERAFDLRVSNHGGTVHAAVVNFEIKDMAGAKIAQQFVADQRLAAGATRSFRFTWRPSAKGRFHISAGIFGPGWSPKHKIVEALATVEAP